ncbi:putative coiled-coil domain-containing protein 196 [Rhinolophus ferrumequinum]|uniref:putative coiled-coil domain-containing protein 196 n=1 Tax=Rhinolophus ferrumequinum TaxID=59479 RepID=UPI00140F9479|nr:putative coiled-coil domain-containing protein 196 [Rhinolophus ferrumequinum]
MTSSSNSPGSYLPSKTRSSKIDDNYLKELNEDLKQRKQELLEMLTPLKDKNNLLFQMLMSNLEEKQRSLQIMRQIMAGKGSEESSVMELIKEAEEMKQNLERKNKMLRKEMEMLWNKTFNTEEIGDQQKTPQIKNKANLQDGKAPQTPSSPRKIKNELETSCAEKLKEIRKEKQQRKIEWVRYQEQANILQNAFNGKVIELRIEALKNYQKANDLKLSLYLQQNFEPNQAFFNLPGSQGTVGTTTMGRATTGKNESDVRILGSKTCTEQQGTKRSQCDDAGGRLFLRSLPDESLEVLEDFHSICLDRFQD